MELDPVEPSITAISLAVLTARYCELCRLHGALKAASQLTRAGSVGGGIMNSCCCCWLWTAATKPRTRAKGLREVSIADSVLLLSLSRWKVSLFWNVLDCPGCRICVLWSVLATGWVDCGARHVEATFSWNPTRLVAVSPIFRRGCIRGVVRKKTVSD